MKIVAELGVNTNGDLPTALRMVDAAAECGCDGVKVQAYQTKDFLPEGHPDFWLFERNRLNWKQILVVRGYTKKAGLLFGATPTSLRGVQRLADMQVDFLKNGSDYLLRHDMIEAMVNTGIETWVSTGMAENKDLWSVRRDANLMACTSSYPCPDEDANLRRVPRFAGYSDHTLGSVAAVIACTLGARMFEKHFTLDKKQEGPDHWFSADPLEMRFLVSDVRRAEQMLGHGMQRAMPSEDPNRDKWRVTVAEPLRG